MSEEKRIAEMRMELEAAGYTEVKDGNWHWRNGFIAAYTAIFPSIDSAYRHYEEGRYFEAMEAFIRRVADATSFNHRMADGEIVEAYRIDIEGMVKEAKRILGEEQEAG